MEVINFIIAFAALAIAILAYHRATRGEIKSLKEQIDLIRESAAEALEKVEDSIRPQK